MKTEPTLNKYEELFTEEERITIKKLDKIKDLMENGQWSDAILKFKHLNCTAREYQEYLDAIMDFEKLRDFALLGFYTKETIH